MHMLYPQSDKKYAYITDFSKTDKSAGNVKIWLGADFGEWSNCYGTVTDGDKALAGSLVSVNAGAIGVRKQKLFINWKLTSHRIPMFGQNWMNKFRLLMKK